MNDNKELSIVFCCVIFVMDLFLTNKFFKTNEYKVFLGHTVYIFWKKKINKLKILHENAMGISKLQFIGIHTIL